MFVRYRKNTIMELKHIIKMDQIIVYLNKRSLSCKKLNVTIIDIW